LVRSYPLVSRFFLFVLIPLAVLLTCSLAYLRGSLAIANGRLYVPALHATTTIERDSQGVVHIKGKSEHDVYFAMGFAHAQDRLWQLELERRVTQGRLSEVFGERTIRQDIWFRTLGLYAAAATAWPALSTEAQASLTAYADGINACIDTGKALPPEFLLLGIKPAHWRPLDSVAMIKLLALDLGTNLTQEIEHYLSQQTLSADQLKSLYSRYPDTAPTTVAGDRVAPLQAQTLIRLRNLQSEIETDFRIGGRYVGSNAWVIAGQLTANGKPILANDPHMGLQMPSLWYAVSQSGGQLKAQGMSLVGLPVVIFGKNEQIAWGGTNMMADTQDLYFEQLDGLDRSKYRSGDQWKQFSVRNEVIQVKAPFPASLHEPLQPVNVSVRESERGPVISDVVATFDQAVSLRWTALDAGDTTYESFFRLSYAKDWDAFKAALSNHVAPALNMLYVDQANNIGYIGAGRIPVRTRGEGDSPSPGWLNSYRWDHFIPAASMPQSYNPKRGFLVSANNKIIGPEYPYFISNDWAPPARARRIEQMIEKRVAAHQAITLADMQTMHSDVLNLEAKEILPILTHIQGETSQQRKALQYLSAWNGEMAVGSQAATIYMVWMAHLRTQLFGPGLQGSWNAEEKNSYLTTLTSHVPVATVQTALSGTGVDWCAARSHGGNCDYVLKKALNESLKELEKLQGSAIENWKWGDVHAIHFKHTPFSDVRLLDNFFGRKLASGGAPDTINATNATFQGSLGYVQDFGAAFRQIMQPGDGSHLYIIATGQSGHPLSAHFDDMIAPYGHGQYFELPTGPARPAASVLKLEPTP
jgi:penicillin amidase